MAATSRTTAPSPRSKSSSASCSRPNHEKTSISRSNHGSKIYISRGCDEKGTVLFTGYYRPIFDARHAARQRVPLSALQAAANLVQDPITGRYAGKAAGDISPARRSNTAPWPARGSSSCYLRDRFEAYIVTVQGSGKLRMPDGRFFEIGYAGDNGHDYQSIGQNAGQQQTDRPRGALAPGPGALLQAASRAIEQRPGDQQPVRLFHTAPRRALRQP